MNWELALGVLAVAVAAFALVIAKWADNKMKAIANLEFDEKRATMAVHQNSLTQGYNQAEFDTFECNVEALAHVAKWADKTKRTRAANAVDAVVQAVQTNVPQSTVNRLGDLSQKIRGLKT